MRRAWSCTTTTRSSTSAGQRGAAWVSPSLSQFSASIFFIGVAEPQIRPKELSFPRDPETRLDKTSHLVENVLAKTTEQHQRAEEETSASLFLSASRLPSILLHFTHVPTSLFHSLSIYPSVSSLSFAIHSSPVRLKAEFIRGHPGLYNRVNGQPCVCLHVCVCRQNQGWMCHPLNCSRLPWKRQLNLFNSETASVSPERAVFTWGAGEGGNAAAAANSTGPTASFPFFCGV